MNLKLKPTWKVVLKLSDEVDLKNSKLFNIRTGNSFLKKTGGIISFDFLPIILEPTNIFYNKLHFVKKENNITGKKFPFEYIENNNLYKVNINIHLYKSIIIFTIFLNNYIIRKKY